MLHFWYCTGEVGSKTIMNNAVLRQKLDWERRCVYTCLPEYVLVTMMTLFQHVALMFLVCPILTSVDVGQYMH